MLEHEALLEASTFIHSLEKRQNLLIGCIEEICLRNGWVNVEHLRDLLGKSIKTDYDKYLENLCDEIKTENGDQFCIGRQVFGVGIGAINIIFIMVFQSNSFATYFLMSSFFFYLLRRLFME